MSQDIQLTDKERKELEKAGFSLEDGNLIINENGNQTEIPKATGNKVTVSASDVMGRQAQGKITGIVINPESSSYSMANHNDSVFFEPAGLNDELWPLAIAKIIISWYSSMGVKLEMPEAIATKVPILGVSKDKLKEAVL